jgi:N-methylhydantoinase A/oxoprolinase/acetone carboxylase beta subunit
MCGLAVSDVNLLLGKLRPEYFPSVFGPSMDQPLDGEIVKRRFADVTQRINSAFPHLPNKDVYEVASGFLAIAIDHMAIAIKVYYTRGGGDKEGVIDLSSVCVFHSLGFESQLDRLKPFSSADTYAATFPRVSLLARVSNHCAPL